MVSWVEMEQESTVALLWLKNMPIMITNNQQLVVDRFLFYFYIIITTIIILLYVSFC